MSAPKFSIGDIVELNITTPTRTYRVVRIRFDDQSFRPVDLVDIVDMESHMRYDRISSKSLRLKENNMHPVPEDDNILTIKRLTEENAALRKQLGLPDSGKYYLVRYKSSGSLTGLYYFASDRGEGYGTFLNFTSGERRHRVQLKYERHTFEEVAEVAEVIS